MTRRVCSAQGWLLLGCQGILSLSVLALGDWGYFPAIAIWLGVMLLNRKNGNLSQLWRKQNAMNMGSFFWILSAFTGMQAVYYILSAMWQQLWQGFGMEYNPVSTLESGGWSVLLYVGLVAPVAEELLFRGVILRRLQPFGKQFAILASSLLFAVFHGNLLQGCFAFGIGLILGYVTAEYHILWAVGLHMFNNLVLAGCLPWISQCIGLGEMLAWLVVLCAGAVTVVLLARRGEVILGYLRRGIQDAPGWQAFFTAPGIVLFLIFMAISAVMMEWSVLRS